MIASYSHLFLLVTFAVFADAIEWKPYSLKHGIVPHSTEAFSARIPVPADYDSSGNPAGSKTINIYARSYRTGYPDNHVWLIPGGPGEKGNAVESSIGFRAEFWPDNTWFYVLDHRGLGGSARISTKETMEKCIKDPMICASRLAIPLNFYSPKNAARDLIRLGEMVKTEHPNGKHVLAGYSYGTVVAYLALRYAPNLYDAILFHKFVPSLRPYAGDVKKHLLEACNNSSGCRAKVGDTKSLDKLVSQLQNPDNRCIRMLEKATPGLFGEFGSTGARAGFQTLLRVLLVIDKPYLAILLAKIFQECPGTKDVARFLNALYIGQSVGQISPSLHHGLRIDVFLLSFFHSCEKKDFPNEMQSCLAASESSWIDPCFKGLIRENHYPFCYKAEAYERNPPSTTRTRIMLIQGKLDGQTLYDNAIAAFAAIKAPWKRVYTAPLDTHRTTMNNCILRAHEELLNDAATGSSESQSTIQCFNDVTAKSESMADEMLGFSSFSESNIVLSTFLATALPLTFWMGLAFWSIKRLGSKHTSPA